MSLNLYNRKRNFRETPEPKGKAIKKGRGPLRFVVQMHSATRLHFDLRLEFEGVFKSWAVPKGPSLNPLDQRLAVFVEDHPLEYGSFEGIIPKGNYGAGTVLLWDEGSYVERGSEGRDDSEKAMRKGFDKGHITFVLDGHKLKGEFALIKLKKDEGERAWLLVKKRDQHSTYKRTQIPGHESVKSGRSIEEIAREAEADGDVWLPKQKNPQKLKRSADERKNSVTKMTQSQKPVSHTKKTSKSDVQIKKTSDILTSKKATGRDPIPRKIKPMLATVSRHGVSGKEWIFEPAYDGVRALAEVEGKRVHLYSRSGLRFEKKYAAIVDELKAMNENAAFDGVIVEARGHATYIVFDILYHQGRDLRDEPLRERLRILKKVSFGKLVRSIKFEKTKGPVVAKNLKSSYRSGTTDQWLSFADAGKVETLPVKAKAKRSAKLVGQKSQVGDMLSKSGPSKPRPSSEQSKHRTPATLEEPRLTNLDKVFFPDNGITKGDLIEYYKSISSYLLPYLKDRPESLNRQPNGIAAPGFYQKDMTGHIPRWLKTTRIFSESAEKSVDYVLCQDERSLLYIVNLGCIEINPWFSRTQNLEKPDFMVIDLDPDGNHFDHVIEIAHEAHDILDEVGAKSFCKTSGATGIHIGIPTGAKYGFDEVREFAEGVCRIIAKKYPATTSVDRNPNRRRGKIYLDFMQNRRGQTLAAPFCVRPKPGATVSMPVTWKELRPGLSPADFHIGNALRLIKKQNEAWSGVLAAPINLRSCLKKLKSLK